MQLEDYFGFLAPNDIRLKGHRLELETILFDYLELTPPAGRGSVARTHLQTLDPDLLI